MTTIKRQGYPDITDEDLRPISQLLECIGVGVVNPLGLIGAPEIVRTVIVGDEDD